MIKNMFDHLAKAANELYVASGLSDVVAALTPPKPVSRPPVIIRRSQAVHIAPALDELDSNIEVSRKILRERLPGMSYQDRSARTLDFLGEAGRFVEQASITSDLSVRQVQQYAATLMLDLASETLPRAQDGTPNPPLKGSLYQVAGILLQTRLEPVSAARLYGVIKSLDGKPGQRPPLTSSPPAP